MARCFVELRRTDDDGVEGVLVSEETGQPQPFSGWLELLRLLEVIAASGGHHAEHRPND
jgi:hypothetical protein